jgi:hypothetical protein
MAKKKSETEEIIDTNVIEEVVSQSVSIEEPKTDNSELIVLQQKLQEFEQEISNLKNENLILEQRLKSNVDEKSVDVPKTSDKFTHSQRVFHTHRQGTPFLIQQYIGIDKYGKELWEIYSTSNYERMIVPENEIINKPTFNLA